MSEAVDSLLRTSVELDPSRPALIQGDWQSSYGEFDAAVDRLAERLGRLAGPADRVALVAPNVPALVVALFASWRLGAVAVPLGARLREYELRQVLADAKPSAIVSVAAHQGFSFAELVPSLLDELPSVRGLLFVDESGETRDEVSGRGTDAGLTMAPGTAAILYTSGTTGAPKGALVTGGCASAGGVALAERLELSSEDVSALIIPISHAFGLGALLAALSAGGAVVLVEQSFSLDPLVQAIADRGANVLHGSPALFGRMLASAPEALADVRTGLVAGAPCPPSVLERLDAAGPVILNVFGMTEIGAACACHVDDPPELRHTTVGRALPGYEFRSAGGEPDGTPGEIQVRGPHVTPGYLERPEETAEAFDGEWFRTGDLGSVDEQGYIRIEGRAKEVVHVGGFNVFPAEVEAFFLTHPDVAQVVVVGVPHERMGEALAAFVVPRPGAELEPSALLRFARPKIAGYKLPYAIRVVEELPFLPTGKPDRAALLASERDAADAAVPAS